MASTNNYAYSNGGAATPPNAFVNNLLQSTAPGPPFTATGAITNSLLPPSVVDDPNAHNQLQFPHPGPHDYPWAAAPPPQHTQAQLHHAHPQQQPQQNHPQQQTSQQHDMHNKNTPIYHRNHQQLRNSRDHVQHSAPLPTSSAPLVVSSAGGVPGGGGPPVGVGSGAIGSQPIAHHNGVGIVGGVGVGVGSSAYPFNTLPLSAAAAAAGSPTLVPIAFDESALPRGGSGAPGAQHIAIGAPLAAPLAHSRYPDQLVPTPQGSAPLPVAAPAPAPPPKKPPRARSRRRKSTQPPGTPCVPVHLRNPKKGRDRVFRKCQFCNADNHIRRSTCEKCEKPLPAGKRRRDGSMHYEKLKRQKNTVAALGASVSVGPGSLPSNASRVATADSLGNVNTSPSPTNAPLSAPPPVPAPLSQHQHQHQQSPPQPPPVPAPLSSPLALPQHTPQPQALMHAQAHAQMPVNPQPHLDKNPQSAGAHTGTAPSPNPTTATTSDASAQTPLIPLPSAATGPMVVEIEPQELDHQHLATHHTTNPNIPHIDDQHIDHHNNRNN